MRGLFAAAARPAGTGSGSGSLAPRRLARPSTLRPLQAAGVAAPDAAAAAAADADGGEGMHSLAASGVVEPALTWPARTHGCGEVTEADVGQQLTVCGWVDRYRNLGGILFLDVRDHTGIVQVIVDPQAQPEVAAKAERLRSEWVVAVSGALRLRTDPNPRMKTGTLEISPSDIKVRMRWQWTGAGTCGQAGCRRADGDAVQRSPSCMPRQRRVAQLGVCR